MVDDPNTFDNPTVDADNMAFLLSQGLTQAQAAADVKENKIHARLLNNMQVNARIGQNSRLEVFLGVQNMTNVKPPKLVDGLYYDVITGTTTAADVYDPIGRRFYAGAQVHF